MSISSERSLLSESAFWSFFVLFAAWLFFFWPTIAAIYSVNTETWVRFSIYGLSAIALFLVFIRHEVFYQAVFTSSQLGLFALFLLATIYIIGNVFHLDLLQVTAVMAMIPAILMISFGRELTRVLLIPILCWFLIIPLQDEAIIYRPVILLFVLTAMLGYIFYLRIARPDLGLPLQRPAWVYENKRWLIPCAIAFFILMSSPWLGENIRDFHPGRQKVIDMRAPLAGAGWRGPFRNKPWIFVPQFLNATATLQVQYLANAEQERSIDPVYLFSAYYDSDRSFKEIFDPKNAVFDSSLWKQIDAKAASASIGQESFLPVNELVLQSSSLSILVWYWYYIAGYSTTDLMMADLLDRVRLVSKYAQGSGVIMVSAPINTTVEDARKRLNDFLSSTYHSLDIMKRPEVRYINAFNWLSR